MRMSQGSGYPLAEQYHSHVGLWNALVDQPHWVELGLSHTADIPCQIHRVGQWGVIVGPGDVWRKAWPFVFGLASTRSQGAHEKPARKSRRKDTQAVRDERRNEKAAGYKEFLPSLCLFPAFIALVAQQRTSKPPANIGIKYCSGIFATAPGSLPRLPSAYLQHRIYTLLPVRVPRQLFPDPSFSWQYPRCWSIMER